GDSPLVRYGGNRKWWWRTSDGSSRANREDPPTREVRESSQNTLVAEEGEPVPRLSRDCSPFGADRREVGVPFRLQVDLGDLQGVGDVERLAIDLTPAHHEDLGVVRHSQRLLQR